MTIGTQGNTFGLGLFPRGFPSSVTSKFVDGLFCGVTHYMMEVNDRGMLRAAMRTLLFCLVVYPVLTFFPFVSGNLFLVLNFVLFVPALGVLLLSGFSFVGVFKWH